MRPSLIILFSLTWLTSFGQDWTESDLVGCWTLVELVDTSKTISYGKPTWDDTVEFQKNGKYRNSKSQGDFELKKGDIIFYKSSYTDADRQMAEFLGKPLKEATRVELSDVEMTGDFLYYTVYSEEEPLIMRVKYKRENCR